MQRLWWLVIVLALGLVGCQLGSGRSDQDGGKTGSGQSGESGFPTYRLKLEEKAANLGQLDMQLNQIGPFHGRFLLEFSGETDWTYQVDTRSDGANIEYFLTIHGIGSSQNPGDVRLVNSGGNNSMSGPGTGGFCVQFPDSFRTEKLFLSPTDFIHVDEFSTPPREEGSSQVAGRTATEFTASNDDHRGWQEVVVHYWVDTETGAVLKYDFVAWGNDPLYQKGIGRIHGVFEVLETGPQEIEGITGCEIGFPLPGDASDIIRLPGIIRFTTSRGPVNLDNFYTQRLEPAGWERQEPQINPQTRDGVLEYTSGDTSVTIQVEALNVNNFEEGFLIEVFLEE